MIKSIKLSLRPLPDAAPGPSRSELAKFFRSLKSGGEKLFSLDAAFIEADKLIDGQVEYSGPKYVSATGNAMYYALTNCNTVWGDYPLINESETFKDLPRYFKISIEYEEKTLRYVEEQKKDERDLKLLDDAVAGNAESAIEFCKKLKSGEIRWGVPRG